MREGVIIKSTGRFYEIKDLETQEVRTAIIQGKFKLKGFKLTNPVAVGDKVSFMQEKDLAIIKKIHNRVNYVVRQSPRKKHYLHLLASNIDQAILITTLVKPKLKKGFIDRFLLMTEPYNIPVCILINKSDLFSEKEEEQFKYLQHIYKKIGYPIFKTSAREGTGIEELNNKLNHKTSLFAGQSGVGKSSIINLLMPELGLKTQILSDSSGKGQHTTTFAEMYYLDVHTHIIDTPGIKSLSFNHLEIMDVAHNFREFFVTSKDCRFRDCTHRNEPQCAVKEAVQNDQISSWRYQNYLQILEELENQNYWERIKDY